MAIIRGGDIRQFTLDGREFDVAADANVNVDLGGRMNETEMNGNQTVHGTQKAKVAGITDVPVSIDSTRQDQEFLQERQTAGALIDVQMTLASNIVYGGKLVLTGELQFLSGDGKSTLALTGGLISQI